MPVEFDIKDAFDGTINNHVCHVRHVADQSEGETATDEGPRKIIIWKDRNKSVQLLNVYKSLSLALFYYCLSHN